jgi:hypothetical protein
VKLGVFSVMERLARQVMRGRTWVEASERALAFGREQMARLRGGTA